MLFFFYTLRRPFLLKHLAFQHHSAEKGFILTECGKDEITRPSSRWLSQYGDCAIKQLASLARLFRVYSLRPVPEWVSWLLFTPWAAQTSPGQCASLVIAGAGIFSVVPFQA